MLAAARARAAGLAERRAAPRHARGAADRRRDARRRDDDARAAPPAVAGASRSPKPRACSNPAAACCIVDMAPHEREEYRQQMGHVWLGFSEDQIRRLLDAGRAFARDAFARCRRRPKPRARRCLRRRRDERLEATKLEVRSSRTSLDLVTNRSESMSTAVADRTRVRSRPQGRPPAVQGRRSRPGRVGPQGNAPRRAGDARPDGAARALRRQEAARRRARHGLAAHDDSDGGAHRDARRDLGADVRWVSCNIFSTQDHAAAAVVVGRPETGGTAAAAARHSRCSRGRARRSRTTGGARRKRSSGRTASGPTLIVDDGGDATLFVHKAYEFEKAGKVPAFDEANDPEEWGVILETIRKELKARPGVWTQGRARASAASPKRRRRACIVSTR